MLPKTCKLGIFLASEWVGLVSNTYLVGQFPASQGAQLQKITKTSALFRSNCVKHDYDRTSDGKKKISSIRSGKSYLTQSGKKTCSRGFPATGPPSEKREIALRDRPCRKVRPILRRARTISHIFGAKVPANVKDFSTGLQNPTA